jgi:four helix bundle protein
MKLNSYTDLKVFQTGLNLFYKVHKLTLQLPKHELYCLGDQLRRSADSTVTNIVEGYGRRMYKAEYIRFLTFSHASCLETGHHLMKLQHLYPDLQNEAKSLIEQYDNLGASLWKYISYVKQNWLTESSSKRDT